MTTKVFFSYDDIHCLTENVISDVVHSGAKFDYIVGLSRGGLLPATIASHYMGLRMEPLQWSTRDHNLKIHHLGILDDLAGGAHILLIDDINDSGKTFIDLFADWQYNKQSSKGIVTTATVLQRYTTKLPSDYYGKLIENDDWVVFPWESV